VSDINDYLIEKKHMVDDKLKLLLDEFCPVMGRLKDAIQYAVFTGGKRFRPILCLASSEAAGIKEEHVIPLSCSLELIHNYSLIHDDLPCMDNDDYRRGNLTCHKKFDEATALLAGDGLLTLAFEVITRNYLSSSNPEAVLKVIDEISSASGIRGMVGGQVIDLTSSLEDIGSIETLHRMKTGALIRASVRVGPLLGDMDEHHVKALTRYGELVGLSYQIMDDVLDYGKDERKNNFLVVYSVAEARKKIVELTEEAVESIKDFGDNARRLKDIAWYLCRRSY